MQHVLALCRLAVRLAAGTRQLNLQREPDIAGSNIWLQITINKSPLLLYLPLLPQNQIQYFD
jgi:hypothetical protein